jgi:septum formation protein
MLTLASASPRRQELLRNAGIEFEVLAVDIDESRRSDEPAVDLCQRLAREKAEAAFARLQHDAVRSQQPIVAADTIVVLGDDQTSADIVLGKPADQADARRMLQALSGREHRVMTGVCVMAPGGRSMQIEIETTAVFVVEISAAEIDEYVASGEPMDKAGAYAIQGRASRWIPRIEGCYFNVVGLPVARVFAMLKAMQS